MKKKFIFLAVICTLLISLLSACDAQKAGSLKSLTRPYIAQYECYEATLGGEDILKNFDYIKINLADKEKLELIYKLKDKDKSIYESNYSFNTETRELTADIGIFGYKFRQSVIVQNGKFTVKKEIGKQQLIMKFQAK